MGRGYASARPIARDIETGGSGKLYGELLEGELHEREEREACRYERCMIVVYDIVNKV